VVADALSAAVFAVAASPVVQIVTDSTQAPQRPVSLSPPKAKSTKPSSNPHYQTRWEREKAKAIQDGINIEHTSGHRGTGGPQTIGPWVIGEMLGKGASGMWFPRLLGPVYVVLDDIGPVLAEEQRRSLWSGARYGRHQVRCNMFNQLRPFLLPSCHPRTFHINVELPFVFDPLLFHTPILAGPWARFSHPHAFSCQVASNLRGIAVLASLPP
jgi:hypothetical protein